MGQVWCCAPVLSHTCTSCSKSCTECAVPALLSSNPQPTAPSPRGWMFLQNQDMGTAALGWDHIPTFLQQERPGLYEEGCLLQANCGFSLSLPRGHNGVQSCISALHSNVSGPQWKGISPVPPSMHGLFPHSHFHDSPQTNLCSVPPFSPSPSSQRAVVFLAAMEDMETISLSGSARPGRSLGSRHSSAKASSKIMFLGASTQNHLENMRSCSFAAQSHSQYCHVA